jgi:hypothetical protein
MTATAEQLSTTTPPGVGLLARPLPWWLRAATRVMDGLRTEHPRLTPESLVAAASKDAGLPPDFPPHVGEALEVLCRSCTDDAHLHWFGRMNQWEMLVSGLSSYLSIERIFRDRPELADHPLVPPMIVTGIPRSGTTFMHRLLAAGEDDHPLTMAEHIFPAWDGSSITRRIRVESQFLPWLRASKPYGIDAMHLVRPGLPDECTFGMRLTGRSLIYWEIGPVYGYLRWLLAQDLRETYAFYRKVLLLHQLHQPGKRLILKCPQHLGWLPSLVAAIPEAMLVETHRDPLTAVASECKLVLSIQSIATHRIDWRRTIEHNRLKVRTLAERSAAFHDTEQGQRVFHIDYERVVSDPVGLARSIREHFGLDFTDARASATARYAKRNRQHKHGKNHYSNEQFGLDPKLLEHEFRAYRERFIIDGVPTPAR